MLRRTGYGNKILNTCSTVLSTRSFGILNREFLTQVSAQGTPEFVSRVGYNSNLHLLLE